MKTIKKLVALSLAVVMTLAMMTTAFAANHTITLTGSEAKPTSGHTYDVYQIFTGDVQEDGKLVNIKYGSAGVGTKGKAVPESVIEEIKTQNDARAYAQSLNIANLTAIGTLDADNNFSLEVADGYYLIVDKGGDDMTEGDSLSAYMVKVVKDVTMAPKSEIVTSDKKEYNDAVELTNVNEAGVGTVVSYDLTAKIAVNAGEYDYYYFVLRDKLSSGLTFNNDIKVTIGGNPAAEGTDYKVYTGDDYTFQIALLDAKSHAGQIVKVEYSATLNDSAVIIPGKEENTFDVEYSRNPEEEYNGTNKEDKPGLPDEIKVPTDALGKTPEKKTETYTTKLELTKKDEKGNLLAGATFNLHSDNANQTVINTHDAYVLDDANGTYYRLTDGTYTETAPVVGTTSEYVKVGTGDANTTKGYIYKDGAYVVPENVKDYDGADLYMLVKKEGNENKYASVTEKYRKETVTETSSIAAPVDMTFTTGTDGKISFERLGTGTYTLTEVDAPDGYNYADPITFTVKFDAENKTFFVDPSVEDITVNAGLLSTTIVDKSGSTLPETGGMGTTLFYLVGGILVVGAGVLLITKRRMTTR